MRHATRSGFLRAAHLCVIGAILVFLLAPVLLVFPLSLSADSYVAWPPSGWSARWYAELWDNRDMIEAFRNSIVLALVVTVATLLIATPAAAMLVRRPFRGREIVLLVLTAPLLLPSIVLGLAILIVFVGHGLVGSWPGLILAHLVVTLPYALRVLMTGFETLPGFVEEAAETLGSAPFSTFCRITLPLMSPALVSAAALTFIVSFDEVVVSLFIAGTTLKVLPVSLYFYVENRTDPLVAAVSAVVVTLTLALVLVVENSVGLRRAVAK